MTFMLLSACERPYVDHAQSAVAAFGRCFGLVERIRFTLLERPEFTLISYVPPQAEHTGEDTEPPLNADMTELARALGSPYVPPQYCITSDAVIVAVHPHTEQLLDLDEVADVCEPLARLLARAE